MPNLLRGVTVQKIGLVEKGAVGEDFLILKSENGGEKMAEPKEPNMLEKLAQALNEVLHPTTHPIETSEVKSEITKAEEVKTDEVKTEEVAKTEEVKKEVKEEVKTEVVKVAPENGEDESYEVNTKLDELKKSQDETKERLEKAETELQKTNEELVKAREQQDFNIYLEKAAGYPNLPVEKSDLAKHLHVVGKASTETLTYLEGLLTAANNVYKDSEMFKEWGSRNVPKNELSDKVEALIKSGQAKDYADALLKLSPEDQKAYLNKRHSELAKGG